MKKLVLATAAFSLLMACSNNTQRDSPADTNQQQGNPNAKPASEAQSPANTDQSQPSDNKAGRNAHSNTPHANDNK
jgi:hypothetical protein